MGIGSQWQEITIEVNTPTTGPWGENQDWNTFKVIRSFVSQMKGERAQYLGQTETGKTYEFKCRWFNEAFDNNARYRISWKGNIYEIREINNQDERNRYLYLVAVRK